MLYRFAVNSGTLSMFTYAFGQARAEYFAQGGAEQEGISYRHLSNN